MERRFHNPYKYWASGFLFEVAVFIGFVLVVIAVALISAWIFG